MRLESAYSHHHGVQAWQDIELYEWITDVFTNPSIKIASGATSKIRNYLREELTKEGWAFDVRINQEVDLTVFAKKEDMVIQLQTGNISRYAYDLLKIQHLYLRREINTAVIAVPTKHAASVIGSNIANSERICSELCVFDRIITVPIMLIAFE